MTPKPLRENPPPCVYCGLDSVSWTQVPAHILCPECQTDKPGDAFHVITVSRPVCLAHHPFPAEVRSEIEWEQLEKEREEKTEAKHFLMGPIFGAENGDKTIGQIKAEAYAKFSKKAVDTALAELREGDFTLY